MGLKHLGQVLNEKVDLVVNVTNIDIELLHGKQAFAQKGLQPVTTKVYKIFFLNGMKCR